MASFRLVTLLLMLIDVVVLRSTLSADALSMDYYAMACPFAELIVSSTVNQALQNDPTLAAALLRMHFHDCFVQILLHIRSDHVLAPADHTYALSRHARSVSCTQGCDGSILIDTTKDNAAEKDSPANLSLRGYEIIDQAKQEIEDQCPGVVSCADILAMAARDAVLWAGGPIYVIPKGRKDGRRSKIEDTVNLPPPSFNSSNLIRVFGQRGFTVQEMVVLSGAHTLGAARCSSFKNRLSKFDTTHDVDPSLDPGFARTLARTCTAGGDTAEAPFDQTRNSFDNAYFNALQMCGGVLTSDQSLFTSPQTRGLVGAYAMNQARFFFDFSQAIVKMGLLDVKEGTAGEVRRDCRRVN